jgi:hypothetical protein
MTPNLRRSIELLVDTIAIVLLISWISSPAASAQPSSPPEKPQPRAELTQAPRFICGDNPKSVLTETHAEGTV